MASSSLREEQLRSNRRLARQILGAVSLVLVAIGLSTVIGWCVSGLRSVLDDSGRKESYADRLYGLVIFDALAFEDASAVDPALFKQAAVWGAIYLTQKNGGSLDEYERDSETGSILLPKLEVDTYISNLLGPDYEIPEGGFSTSEFNYQYDAEKQCYLVPVTGSVALYTPQVEKISTQSGKTYVTVGYIPTMNNSANGELSLTAPTEPTKYMDYVFTRGSNRQWYLSALQESEMKPAATASPAPNENTGVLDTQTMVEENLDSTMTDAAGANALPQEDTAGEAAGPSAEEAAPDEGGEPPAEAEPEPNGGDETEPEPQPEE